MFIYIIFKEIIIPYFFLTVYLIYDALDCIYDLALISI